MRGGRLPDGGWMIMGSGESPRLANLYHEVLAINTELTNLIRELTREQAVLTGTINRLLERPEIRAMPNVTEHTVAQRLAELRPAILPQLTEQLIAALPMISLDPRDTSHTASHYAQMYATAQRFHDLVQLGATADWGLTSFEYDWAAHVLQPKGVTWEHQAFLIETYFATAGRLATWSDEERAILDKLAKHLYADGAQAYQIG
jgi:hypothetical protein